MRSLLVLLTLFALSCSAQSLSPQQRAYLDQLYARSGNGSIPGSWLMPGSLTTNQLSFPVIQTELDPTVSSAAKIISGTDTTRWNTVTTKAALSGATFTGNVEAPAFYLNPTSFFCIVNSTSLVFICGIKTNVLDGNIGVP